MLENALFVTKLFLDGWEKLTVWYLWNACNYGILKNSKNITKNEQ